MSVALCVWIGVSPLRAQERDAEEGKRTDQQLRLNGSWTGGYDSDLVAQSVGVVDPRLQQGGAHTGGGIGFIYSRHQGRIDLGGDGNSFASVYGTSARSVSSSYDGNFRVAFDLTRRAQFRLTGDALYSPYYQFDAFPQLLEPGHLRVYYIVHPQRVLNAGAVGALDYKLGKKSSLELEFTRRKTSFLNSELDLSTTGESGRFTRVVSRFASARVSYLRQRGRYVANNPVRAHSLDAGFDFNRGGSISPRTVAAFGFGTAAVQDGRRILYRPTGQAAFSHRFSRGWTGKIDYQRVLSFVGGYQQPMFTDEVTVGVLQRVSKKAAMQWQGGYSNGAFATGPGGNNGVKVYYGGGQFQLRLGSKLVAFAESFYYGYVFNDLPQFNQPTSRLRRTVAQIGLQVWKPLLAEKESSGTR
jgi:hypothetical protein